MSKKRLILTFSQYYTMGYDVETGERIKANCVESVRIVCESYVQALYIAKKRAARLQTEKW